MYVWNQNVENNSTEVHQNFIRCLVITFSLLKTNGK